MANRNYASGGKLYSMHVMPVLVDGNVAIGATGAVGTVKGPTVSSVTRLSAGRYQIKLQDNYSKFYGMFSHLQAPVTGSAIADGAFSAGTVYQITVVGTTDWNTLGLPAGQTAAVGSVFKAANVGGAGTGFAKAIGNSGIAAVEVIGDPQLELANSNAAVNGGALITIQCLAATDASTTTLIPADPANGSVLYFAMYLSNSSIVINGE